MSKEEKLLDAGTILLSGRIDQVSITKASEDILLLNQQQKVKSINLIINSCGGYVADGFQLVDIMEYSSIPVHTTGLGMCASMGLIILCAGASGKRTITKNTRMLSHQFTGGSYGKYHELVAAREEEDQLHKMIINHYKKHTDLTVKQIKSWLLPAGDVWLTPAEAKEYGLIDNIKR